MYLVKLSLLSLLNILSACLSALQILRFETERQNIVCGPFLLEFVRLYVNIHTCFADFVLFRMLLKFYTNFVFN